MSLSAEIRHIAETLQPGYHLEQSPHATDDERFVCPWCGALVWRVSNAAGMPLLLNREPTAHGRWVMEAPGLAIYCTGIRMVRWPLPRYTSHLIDCVELIRRREAEREMKAEEMRYVRTMRDHQRRQKQDRLKRYERRFD